MNASRSVVWMPLVFTGGCEEGLMLPKLFFIELLLICLRLVGLSRVTILFLLELLLLNRPFVAFVMNLLLGVVPLFWLGVCSVVVDVHENRYAGILLLLDNAAAPCSHSGRMILPFSMEDVIQVRHICAILLCIYGSNIFSDGLGCKLIMVNASRTRGPHSFECGLYVMDLQLIHMEFGG